LRVLIFVGGGLMLVITNERRLLSILRFRYQVHYFMINKQKQQKLKATNEHK
jgi:hypothetical protein